MTVAQSEPRQFGFQERRPQNIVQRRDQSEKGASLADLCLWIDPVRLVRLGANDMFGDTDADAKPTCGTLGLLCC